MESLKRNTQYPNQAHPPKILEIIILLTKQIEAEVFHHYLVLNQP